MKFSDPQRLNLTLHRAVPGMPAQAMILFAVGDRTCLTGLANLPLKRVIEVALAGEKQHLQCRLQPSTVVGMRLGPLTETALTAGLTKGSAEILWKLGCDMALVQIVCSRELLLMN